MIALTQRALDKLRNRHYARAEEINERSLEWLDSLDDGEPFFLWSHYMDTYGPYEPPGEYTYKHTNLKFAENPFTPGDYVIKPDYDDPDLAVVVEISEGSDEARNISIAFLHQFEEAEIQATYLR